MKKRTESNFSTSPQRRRLLGWMGMGILGAFAIKAIPFGLLSKKVAGKNRAKAKVNISINELAVKRNKSKIPNSGKAI